MVSYLTFEAPTAVECTVAFATRIDIVERIPMTLRVDWPVLAEEGAMVFVIVLLVMMTSSQSNDRYEMQ